MSDDYWLAWTREDGITRNLRVGRTWTPPYINTSHVDGPVLTYSNGQMHWLTFWERVALALGWTSAARIQEKRRPDLCLGARND